MTSLILWLTAAIFFGYGHLTRVAPGSMADSLMRDFGIGSTILGNISAMYWYAYAIFQIPGGFFTDKYGPTYIIMFSSLLCVLGGLLFSLGNSLDIINIGRLLTGAGCAAIYASCLKIAYTSFKPTMFAIIGGITLLIGMLGAAIGQAPMAILVALYGRQEVMLWVALFALPFGAITLLIACVSNSSTHLYKKPSNLNTLVLKLLKSRQYWVSSTFTMTIAAPAISFPAWGMVYYMQALQYNRSEAALFPTVSVLGWALGALVIGWATSHMRHRQIILVTTSLSSIIGWSIFVFFPEMPTLAHFFVMALVGFSAGGIVSGFVLITDNCPEGTEGTAIGITNSLVMLVSAIILIIIGFILDQLWQGEIRGGVHIYTPFAYQIAYLVMPSVSLIALIAALCTRKYF